MNARQKAEEVARRKFNREVNKQVDLYAKEIGAAFKSVRLKPNVWRIQFLAQVALELMQLGFHWPLVDLAKRFRPSLKAIR